MLIIYLLLCALVAYFGGKKRIGWATAFFAALLLSPLIGGILVIISPTMQEYLTKKKDEIVKDLAFLETKMDAGLITTEQYAAEKAALLERMNKIR
jgi:hypothetical protein